MCVREGGGEGGRERKREGEKERETERETERDTHTEIERQREAERQTDGQTQELRYSCDCEALSAHLVFCVLAEHGRSDFRMFFYIVLMKFAEDPDDEKF